MFSIELAAYAGVGGGLKFSFTREGFSWCGQVGFGGGINLTVDAEGGLDHEALGVFAEAKASVLGIATVKGKIEALNPCGVGPGNGDVDVKFKSEACIGPACTDADHAYMKLDPTQPEKFIPSLKPEIGISGKVGVKACAQVLW